MAYGPSRKTSMAAQPLPQLQVASASPGSLQGGPGSARLADSMPTGPLTEAESCHQMGARCAYSREGGLDSSGKEGTGGIGDCSSSSSCAWANLLA